MSISRWSELSSEVGVEERKRIANTSNSGVRVDDVVMKEYIACDAVCLVITRNDIDSIPLLSLSLGISRNRYLDYWRRICDNAVSPTPNMPIMYKLMEWQRLCVELLVTASVAVSVPLSVDGLVRSNVDDLSLGLLVADLLSGRGDSGSSDLELGLVALNSGRRGGSAGRGLSRGGGSLLGASSSGSGRGSGAAGAVALLSRSLTTAHVEVHVLVGLAGLGLDVIGEDVGDQVASGGVGAGHDWAPGVGRIGCGGARLVTSNKVVTLLPGGAVARVGRAVNVRDIKVVVVEAGRVALDEVLKLSDVATLALLSLGELDRDTSVSTQRVGVVLLVSLARLESDHLVSRAAVTLVDGPEVHIVGASVVDASHGLAGVAALVEGDCAPGGDSCDHGGRDRKDSNELHFGWI